jgi:hypothetical protein
MLLCLSEFLTKSYGGGAGSDNAHTEQTHTAIGDWLTVLDTRRGLYLFPSHLQAQPHVSTQQYARIVHRRAEHAIVA